MYKNYIKVQRIVIAADFPCESMSLIHLSASADHPILLHVKYPPDDPNPLTRIILIPSALSWYDGTKEIILEWKYKKKINFIPIFILFLPSFHSIIYIAWRVLSRFVIAVCYRSEYTFLISCMWPSILIKSFLWFNFNLFIMVFLLYILCF